MYSTIKLRHHESTRVFSPKSDKKKKKTQNRDIVNNMPTVQKIF